MYDGHRVCFLASDYESIQLKDIKHAWYFEWVFKHIIFIVTQRVYDDYVLKYVQF